MKQLVKTAIIGYCGYKAIDILMSKNESAEVKDEEYVSFDELEVKEEVKEEVKKESKKDKCDFVFSHLSFLKKI